MIDFIRLPLLALITLINNIFHFPFILQFRLFSFSSSFPSASPVVSSLSSLLLLSPVSIFLRPQAHGRRSSGHHELSLPRFLPFAPIYCYCLLLFCFYVLVFCFRYGSWLHHCFAMV
ncbi:hypothetical protein E1A91_D07G132400v1 [Gossypium mustelinum]|uniref:Uncharacterized protein n=1 Tax=Gossypium mustelinum TaxID=34275 RepID=A0A5D2U7E3_GOSMU|nr:hypothetical protein E1A91_D07G132400v1 [Gossypium mustelinum]